MNPARLAWLRGSCNHSLQPRPLGPERVGEADVTTLSGRGRGPLLSLSSDSQAKQTDFLKSVSWNQHSSEMRGGGVEGNEPRVEEALSRVLTLARVPWIG